MTRIITLSITLFSTSLVHAGASPWLDAPQSISGTVSRISQAGSDHWKGKKEAPLPANAKLSLDTTWLDINYGINDNLSTDFKLGYAKSNFDPDGSEDSSESGQTDTSIGLNWRTSDEFINENKPTLTLRAVATIAGDYATDQVNSIGDGASGIASSLLVGKILSPKIALAGEGGYRLRANNVPNEIFVNLNAYFRAAQGLTLNAAYLVVESLGELDITDTNFDFDKRFSQLAESSQIANIGIAYQFLSRYNVAGNYAKIVKGRNTSKNDILGVSLSASF